MDTVTPTPDEPVKLARPTFTPTLEQPEPAQSALIVPEEAPPPSPDKFAFYSYYKLKPFVIFNFDGSIVVDMAVANAAAAEPFMTFEKGKPKFSPGYMSLALARTLCWGVHRGYRNGHTAGYNEGFEAGVAAATQRFAQAFEEVKAHEASQPDEIQIEMGMVADTPSGIEFQSGLGFTS